MTSDADRRRMRAVARSLAEIETDEPPRPEQLRSAIDAANADRAAHGRPPLREVEDLPEEEFYRRARALRLRRLSR